MFHRPNIETEFGSLGRDQGDDRVTSAWLIRKFIDPKAKFAFAPEDQKPAKAVPFDMYEGGFGHRGEDCTFETLHKVFHIRDKKVLVMAEVVHDADLFDEKFGRKEGDVYRLGFPRTDLHVLLVDSPETGFAEIGQIGNDKSACMNRFTSRFNLNGTELGPAKLHVTHSKDERES